MYKGQKGYEDLELFAKAINMNQEPFVWVCTHHVLGSYWDQYAIVHLYMLQSYRQA